MLRSQYNSFIHLAFELYTQRFPHMDLKIKVCDSYNAKNENLTLLIICI